MLALGSTIGTDVFQPVTLKNKQQAIIDAKLSGYGFLATFA